MYINSDFCGETVGPQESILCIKQDNFSRRYMRIHCKQNQRCTVDIVECEHNI